MCTHSIDDLLPHAPLNYAATGDMVKCLYIILIHCPHTSFLQLWVDRKLKSRLVWHKREGVDTRIDLVLNQEINTYVNEASLLKVITMNKDQQLLRQLMP